MKATKKIVGAACALVAAVALSAGSTFAWFVSNASVTATGLQVDVATSNSYLVISDDYNTLRDGTSANKTSITLVSGEAAIKPSAHKEVAESAGGDKITANDLTTATSWYEGKGTSPSDGTLNEETKKDLSTSGLTGYVVEDDIFVSVATGSDDVEHVKLKMTLPEGESWDTSVGNSAISVIVLYQNIANGGSVATWSYVEANAGNNHALGSDAMLDLGMVTEDDYLQIHVMVYFDGNNSDVKGINAASLEGVTLNFEFVDGASIT